MTCERKAAKSDSIGCPTNALGVRNNDWKWGITKCSEAADVRQL